LVVGEDAPVNPLDPNGHAERVVSASVFDVYDEFLVPLVFQGYADDAAQRLADLRDGAILEVAAGTGVVTRALAATLPPEVAITATDLVPGMIERARQVGTARPVTWEQADALALPYESESFDAVVCQFGAMFFEPKAAAFAEMLRVLRPGGRMVCSVWDRVEHNEFAAIVDGAMQHHVPDDPPEFLEHRPYEYHDAAAIDADVRAGGFDAPVLTTSVERVSWAATPVDAAAAFCAGTPLRNEIEARGADALGRAITASAQELAQRFGTTDLQGRISAHFVEAVRR
jgi:ubiquinone/menaquinone biosynthesis C-methylase UbiE